MKANFFLGNGRFSLQEVPTPTPGPGEVLIRNAVFGVCGTDVHIFHGEPGSAEVTPPVVLGHEFSGVIEALGPGVEGLQVGDPVTVDPNIYCGKCEYCRDGKKQLCPHMRAIGVTQNGGFAQYCAVPAAQAFRLADQVPLEYGAMAEPVACCLHGIDRAGIRPGDTVCVVGGGAIGLIMLQLARLSGAGRVVLSEPNGLRRQAALQLGADGAIDPKDPGHLDEFQALCGEGAQVVLECVGNNAAVASAFAFAKKGATVVLFSVPKVDAQFPLPLFDVYKKELTIRGSFVNPDTHARAVALLNAGRLDLGPIITHRFPLSRLQEAIEMQMSDASIKVVVQAQE